MSTTELKAAVAGTANRAQPQLEPQPKDVTMGFGSLQSFELMQRAAKLLASSSLVPKDYQGNMPNCVIALNMAQRIGADPLMVMQNLYIVHGRPGWSSQFLIAAFNQCGRFSAVRYKWSGAEGKDDWSCRAYATERDSMDVIQGPIISIAIAKKEGWFQKSGSKWQSIPELMLMYRAAGWMVRTHAPEIAMGLQTQEELHDVYDAKSHGNGRYSVDLDSLRTEAIDASLEKKVSPEETPKLEGKQSSDYTPQFDKAAAIAAVKEAGSKIDLEKAWTSIALDYRMSNREIDPDIEDAVKAQREVLSKF